MYASCDEYIGSDLFFTKLLDKLYGFLNCRRKVNIGCFYLNLPTLLRNVVELSAL